MRISPISNNNYKQNFGSIYFAENAAKHLNSMSLDELKQIQQWKSELENTQEFDMIVSDNGKDVFIKYEHKTNPINLNSEGPLYPAIDGQKGRKLKAAGVDILDCGDWHFYTLILKNEKRAKEVQCELENLDRRYKNNKTPFEKIKFAVQGLKYLEEGYDHNIEATIENNKGKVVKDSLIDLLIAKKETEKKHNCKVVIEGINDEKIINEEKPTVEKVSQEEKITTNINNQKEDTFLDKLLAKIGLYRIKK